MSEFDTYPPMISGPDDWNQLLDHGLEKPTKFIFKKKSSLVQAINGSTGKIPYDDDDAGSVLTSVLSDISGVGGKLSWKDGEFYFDTKATLGNNHDGVFLQGMGRSTVFKAGSQGAIEMINTGMLDSVWLEDIQFDGQGTAPWGLSSDGSTSALDYFGMHRVRFTGFDAVNAIGCKLYNLERAVIDHCWFGGHRKYALLLGGYDYQAGNITVRDSFIVCANYNDSTYPVGIYVLVDQASPPPSGVGCGNLRIRGNHFYGDTLATTRGRGIEFACLSTSSLAGCGVYSQIYDNRTEYTTLFKNSNVSQNPMQRVSIRDNKVREEIEGAIQIDIGYAEHCAVDKNWITAAADNMIWFTQQLGSSTNYNYLRGNTFAGGDKGNFGTLCPYTIRKNNIFQ